MDFDHHLRAACFLQLDLLRNRYPVDIPWVELEKGFPFGDRGRVHFMSPKFGIYRSPKAQLGPAALSINSSFRQVRYQDEQTPDGWLYHLQSGPLTNHYNRWLIGAYELRVPLVYFIGTGPKQYSPQYPVEIREIDLETRLALVSPLRISGTPDEPAWSPFEQDNERRYVVRQVKQRVHQSRFRSRVLPAYRNRCAICSLKEVQLLDAAHIVSDLDEFGEPVIRNGVCMCTIHHRAFDQNLIGISPDVKVHVARRLLEDEDGPMLELLKTFHRSQLILPQRHENRPDPERLSLRFEEFMTASG